MSFYIIYLIGIHYNFIQDNSHISHFVPNKLGMSIGNSITSPNNLHYRFESCLDHAEIQHNDMVAVVIRRETLMAHSVVYGEHNLNKY